MENQKKRILVVEDEKYLIDLYTEILVQAGYDVDQAIDGEIALAKMTQNVYDLVILDIMLPKIDGLQVLQKLYEDNPKTPNKNIIVLSNVERAQVIADSTSLGIRGYIVKTDITPDMLLKEVRNYLA